MSSQSIKCTLARHVLSLIFGVLEAGCFCPGLQWENCQFCMWCDIRLVSDDLRSTPICLLSVEACDAGFLLPSSG
ncbi:hypothetical protein Peur_011557 [Populus x canadensis]